MNKQDVLEQIRFFAAQNAGIPPGSRQFYRATNTRESVWKNKDWNSWNNWGDAVEEAGFARLEPTSRLDKNQILRQIASLTRRLQRFPVTADMRREKRNNPEFPNDKVISSVFGTRESVVPVLAQYCSENHELHDLLPLLEQAVVVTGFRKSSGTAVENQAIEPKGSVASIGYVYLFKSDKRYKIGSSRAPYRRLSELITQAPLGGKPIHIIETDDPEGIEKYWHRRFEASRIIGLNKASGEWFKLSLTDIAAFKRRRYM